ncbi:PAS domain S-box protein [uncultured Desulfuromusa sp.]|uniref:PAS domain S-box protein n=1 Tax=uncultured Desulfuromusa sp. TaxID=219183 RepID=UPI002AA71EF1|nr:PAS domain S-box protein [uncultured Desulfuromusa sp.]
MAASIFDYLRDSINDYLKLFHQQLLADSFSVQNLFQKQDIILLFHAHATILERLLDNEGCPSLETFRHQFKTEVESFNGVLMRCQSNGLGFAIGIHFFAAANRAFIQLLTLLVFDDTTKIKLLSLFTSQVGMIDTVLVESFERMHKDVSLTSLERQNLKLIGEKSTYKNIFEGTSNLVLITDNDGKIVEANPEANIFFSQQELVGCFCGAPLGLAGTSLAQLLRDYPPNQSHEISLQVNNAKQYFNLQIKPLESTLAVSNAVLLILSDITCMVDHRQLLEQRILDRTKALAKSEKLLGAIFHAVGKGIVLIDTEGEIVKANQQASEIYGIPLEVLIGTPICDLTDSAGCTALENAKQQLFEGQQISAEINSIYVDGKTFPSFFTMTRMDLEGETFWPIIVRDITEEKVLNNKLWEEKRHAEEMNVTLRNVLKSIEEDRKEAEKHLSARIRTSILPGIKKIQKETQADIRESYLTLLKDQLLSLTSGFDAEIDGDLLKLTKSELKICQFIKAGLSGKEICESMNLSFETIQTHRKNIRKKLCLRGKSQSLHQFLASRNCDF